MFPSIPPTALELPFHRMTFAVSSEHKQLIALHALISTHFDKSDLQTLCFYLRIDYDDLPSESKKDKARELLIRLDRHNRIADLFACGKIVRPDVDWDAIERLSAESSALSRAVQPDRIIILAIIASG